MLLAMKSGKRGKDRQKERKKERKRTCFLVETAEPQQFHGLVNTLCGRQCHWSR